MNKITTIFITALIAFAGCAGTVSENGENATPITISAEMEDFMSIFNGKASGVQNAVEKYVDPKLFGYDIGEYNLENPVITSQTGDCYTMESEYSETIRVYEICWSASQINNITFLEERRK